MKRPSNPGSSPRRAKPKSGTAGLQANAAAVEPTRTPSPLAVVIDMDGIEVVPETDGRMLRFNLPVAGDGSGPVILLARRQVNEPATVSVASIRLNGSGATLTGAVFQDAAWKPIHAGRRTMDGRAPLNLANGTYFVEIELAG